MQSDSTFQIVAFIASIASLVVAVGAIWLSVVFFQMSDTASKATTEAAKGIAASVERLEKLFDKLYSDTFSMMRDTVSDMRKHMWPTEDPAQEKVAEEAKLKADERMKEITQELDGRLNDLLARQKLTDANTRGLREEMRSLVQNAITTTRRVDMEAREETAREAILRELRILEGMMPSVTAGDLVGRVKLPPNQTVSELHKLRDDGLVSLSDNEIGPTTVIRSRVVRTIGRAIERQHQEKGGS